MSISEGELIQIYNHIYDMCAFQKPYGSCSMVMDFCREEMKKLENSKVRKDEVSCDKLVKLKKSSNHYKDYRNTLFTLANVDGSIVNIKYIRYGSYASIVVPVEDIEFVNDNRKEYSMDDKTRNRLFSDCIETYESLINSVVKAGGRAESFDSERLREISALELINDLSTNGIRFYFKE